MGLPSTKITLELVKKMKTAKDLLTSSADLLAEIRGSQSQFNRPEVSVSLHTSKYLQVLVPENYKWEDLWLHLYFSKNGTNPPNIPQTGPVGTTVILHGHSRDETCFANTFCHVLGYTPSDGGNKFWKIQWGTPRTVSFVANPFGKDRMPE